MIFGNRITTIGVASCFESSYPDLSSGLLGFQNPKRLAIGHPISKNGIFN